MGFLTGWIAFCGILYWIVPTFKAAGVSLFIGVCSTALLSGYIALYFGIFAGLKEKFLNWGPGILKIALCGALWGSLEYIRNGLFGGFPWGLVGYSQWKVVPVIQFSEITGVYGVSVLILMVNLMIYRVIRERNIKIVSLLLCLFPLGMNFFLLSRAKRISLEDPIPVTLLQGNVDQYKKWSQDFVSEILLTYDTLLKKGNREREVPSDENRLIVWPETSVPGWVPNEQWLVEWIQEKISQYPATHLIGAVSKIDDKNFNSAFLFSENGKVLGRYDKMHLVPFGEFVPIKSLLGKWIPVLNDLGGFDSGEKSRLLQLPKASVGVSICYEAIFSNLIRKQVKQGAELLINMTNDGWYLDTAAPEQHFSMNVFRAVENRRNFIRAANTGISGFISPIGKLLKLTRLNEEAVLNASVNPIQKMTFYSLYGDVFAWLCCLLTFAGSLGPLLKKRKLLQF